MTKTITLLISSLFFHIAAQSAHIIIQLPSKNIIQHAFAKHRLQKFEEKLQIGVQHETKSYSIAELSYQTLLWSLTYASYSKQAENSQLSLCTSSIAWLIDKENPLAGQIYKKIMQNIAKTNEIPTTLNQLEKRLGISSHIIKNDKQKGTQKKECTKNKPGNKRRFSIS